MLLHVKNVISRIRIIIVLSKEICSNISKLNLNITKLMPEKLKTVFTFYNKVSFTYSNCQTRNLNCR